jgi:hypothetical protein
MPELGLFHVVHKSVRSGVTVNKTSQERSWPTLSQSSITWRSINIGTLMENSMFSDLACLYVEETFEIEEVHGNINSKMSRHMCLPLRHDPQTESLQRPFNQALGSCSIVSFRHLPMSPPHAFRPTCYLPISYCPSQAPPCQISTGYQVYSTNKTYDVDSNSLISRYFRVECWC